jgi:hypothetical protein
LLLLALLIAVNVHSFLIRNLFLLRRVEIFVIGVEVVDGDVLAWLVADGLAVLRRVLCFVFNSLRLGVDKQELCVLHQVRLLAAGKNTADQGPVGPFILPFALGLDNRELLGIAAVVVCISWETDVGTAS